MGRVAEGVRDEVGDDLRRAFLKRQVVVAHAPDRPLLHDRQQPGLADVRRHRLRRALVAHPAVLQDPVVVDGLRVASAHPLARVIAPFKAELDGLVGRLLVRVVDPVDLDKARQPIDVPRLQLDRRRRVDIALWVAVFPDEARRPAIALARADLPDGRRNAHPAVRAVLKAGIGQQVPARRRPSRGKRRRKARDSKPSRFAVLSRFHDKARSFLAHDSITSFPAGLQ